MKQPIVIQTPRGAKRLNYTTALSACRQIAERNNWRLVVHRGQLRMEARQHA